MKLIEGYDIEMDASGYYIARPNAERAKVNPNAIQMGLSGGFLWRQLSTGDPSRAELIFGLEQMYECAPETEQVAADVDVFLDFLRSQGLLIE